MAARRARESLLRDHSDARFDATAQAGVRGVARAREICCGRPPVSPVPDPEPSIQGARGHTLGGFRGACTSSALTALGSSTLLTTGALYMAHRDKASAPSPLVLIANDQEWSARSLESILGPSGYSVVRAYTGQQALERARASQPDIIILDAQMPDMHGFEVCRALRSDPRFSSTTPIVITTSGPSGRTQRLEAYRCGAWEFLGQPLDGEALLLKLDTFLRSKRQVDILREENLLDSDTGLYNMRGLARRAREIGSDATRRREALACVVFAPDTEADAGEDETAEEEMHRMSDEVGAVFRQVGRVSDAIGRLGPTEFAVIAPATGADGAVRLVNRLSGAVEATRIAVRGGDRSVRVRAGYCAVPDFAESQVDAVELLLRATTALRDLRAGGEGDRIRAFEQVSLQYPG
jgi:diguanylate cyclase (GGDEF)-like protein